MLRAGRLILFVVASLAAFLALSTLTAGNSAPAAMAVVSTQSEQEVRNVDPAIPYTAIYGDEIVIAVLDSGIDIGHEALKDMVSESVNFTQSSIETDVLGHGTPVAGLVAGAVGEMVAGGSGSPHIKILNVKVVDDVGMVWPSTVAKGIIWAVNHGAQILNMSFTLPVDQAQLREAVKYAAERDLVMLAAAGNKIDSPTYPSVYPEVIAVASKESQALLHPGSAAEHKVDIFVSGSNIYSAMPGNKYGYMSGSSFATACASHTAALKLRESFLSSYISIPDLIRQELCAIYPSQSR